MNHLLTLVMQPTQPLGNQLIEALGNGRISDAGDIFLQIVFANYRTFALTSMVVLLILIPPYGRFGDYITCLYRWVRNRILSVKPVIDNRRSPSLHAGAPESTAPSDEDASNKEDPQAKSTPETELAVTIEPSEAPLDHQAITNAFISLAEGPGSVDLYCVPTDTEAVLPSAPDKESSQIYVVRGDNLTTTLIEEILSGAYPDSFLIQTEPIHQMPLARSEEHSSADELATVEYKCVGSEWTDDTLTPLAPAVETTQTASLGMQKTPPLINAFSQLPDSQCTAIYHVAIRTSDLSSSDLIRLRADYNSGKFSVPEIALKISKSLFRRKSGDTRGPPRSNHKKSTANPESAAYADDFDAIRQASFVEVDPRVILSGSDASETATTLTSQFQSLNVSACTIEGTRCRGLRAGQGYRRAFGPDEGGIRPWLRSKLRSPQYRLPVVKRLTRNQSTRFYVSEYALPHFISMEAPTEGETGGPRIDRRPPTAPPTPPNHVTHPSSDE